MRSHDMLASLLALLVLVSGGCAVEPSPTDASRPDAPLEPFACGTMTCSPDQICVYQGGGTDAGIPPMPNCRERPAACVGAVDCMWDGCDAQESCVLAVCGANPCPTISDSGRVVSCCGV